MILQIVFGIICADVIATFVHWFEDTYIHFCTRIKFLKGIANGNELHHYYPHFITSLSYWENCIVTLILILILYVVLLVFFYKNFKKFLVFWLVVGVFLIIIVLNHRLVHERDCNKNKIIRFIHDLFIVGSDLHKTHHEQPTINYSVFLQPVNIVIDKLHIFRILENIIYNLTGIEPIHKKEYKSYPKTDFHREVERSDCPKKLKKEDVDILLENLNDFYKCSI